MRIFKPLLIATAIFLLNGRNFAQTYNYGEVLQKSMFFYECQQSGPLSTDNRVTWRGNAAMNDGSDVGKNLTGGWFDAGDHVKFNFPMAFSATALAWGAIDFSAGYNSTGQMAYLKKNLRYVNDYFIKCHTAPNELYGQVGNGSNDHGWWGSAEVMQMPRPAYKIDAAHPGSDLAAETASAMAAASIVFKTDDPAYSATLITHAKQLYSFADNYRGVYSNTITDAAGYYRSYSGYNDDLVWGAIWLYRATGEQAYLDKAEAYYANLSTEPQATEKSYRWGISWDDKSYGCYVLMAKLTGKEKYKIDAERHLDYWTDGYNGTRITYTPGGLPFLDVWGSLRYAINTGFLASYYADIATTATKTTKYKNFTVNIMKYILGNNPQNRSYVCGYGNNPPVNPHHRTAHGCWTNNQNGPPTETRHILYGALVGGPGSNDGYTDVRSNYTNNEVACDYNALFSGALAKLIIDNGGTALPNFPVAETPTNEYFNEAKFNTLGATFSEYAVWTNNHTAWPARQGNQYKFRIFVNISEGVAAGYKVTDYVVSSNNAGVVSFTQLLPYDVPNFIYYTEVTFLPSIKIWPGGQSESSEEAQMRIRLPYEAPASAWNPANDWSAQGVDGILKQAQNIPLYVDGKLVFGKEPPPSVTYTITATSGTGGSISPSGAVLVGEGSNQTFTITPSAGYKISDVTVDGSSKGALTTYTFANVAAGHTISATFTVAAIYKITASAGAGGIINPSGNVSVTEGSNQTFVITPLSGYNISDVAVDGVSKGALNSYTFTNVASAHTLAATFIAVPTYQISASAGTGGTITPSGSVTVTQGSNQTYSIIASSGYKIKNVLVDGVSQGAVSSFTFSNIVAAHTIEASFEVQLCDLNIIFGTPLTTSLGNVNSSYKYVHVLGTHAAITNITAFTINWDLPNKGLYQFSINTNNGIPNWYVDLRTNMTYKFDAAGASAKITGSGAGLDGDYYVTVKSGNFVLVEKSAAYAIVFSNSVTPPDGCVDVTKYTIAASAGIGGTITPSGAVSVVQGANQAFVIAASVGYSISDVLVDGVSQGKISSYTFTNVIANHNIAASFSPATDNYTITASAGIGGSISPSGPVIVAGGTNQTFTITPSMCSFIALVFVDGVSQGPIATYTFTNVRANHTISAEFMLPTPITITASAGIGGSITPPGEIVIPCNQIGSNKEYLIIPAPGYKIADVRVDGVSQGAIATYTFNNVTSNHTISASFSQIINYTITASSGTGGTVNPSGAVSVAQGTNQTFAIAASAGYKINDVKVDGISLGAIASYTFTNVTSDHTIIASFDISCTCVITASAGIGGIITPSGSVSFIPGSNITFTITANAGYILDAVMVDGVSVGKVNTYTFTNISPDSHVITATFVPENTCNLFTKYAVPRSSALPTLANISFSHSYTLGTGGPTLTNITNFTINWDLPNKGLWQFSMNTNNGVPTWWLNLLPKISQTFIVPSPACKLTGTGITGLDGDYWANIDGSNFVLVAKSGAYALYFTNGAAPTGCPVKDAQVEGDIDQDVTDALIMFPNPLDKGAQLSINLKAVSEDASFNISDMRGKTLVSGNLKSTENNIMLNGKFCSGLYIVRISNGNEQCIQKLIVK
jgi:endoglucanase